MPESPFGDVARPKRPNPFGVPEDDPRSPVAAAERMDQAARKIRTLRSQIGAEGLTLPATRDLIDEIASALEAGAAALRGLAK